MTDTEINERIREALERACAPDNVRRDPSRAIGCTFRFSRRPKNENDEQRPIVGSIAGFEFDPAGILMIHVNVRTFRGIPFTSIDLNLETNEWSMSFGPGGQHVPGRFTFLN